MGLAAFAASRLGRRVTRLLASAMESRLRYRFFGPDSILKGVELRGQNVLEIGCGTGFFSIPAASVIGEEGRLTAMDVLPESVELVWRKAQAAGLRNLRAIAADARQTNLDSASIDTVLLFGVIPAPMLPLAQLLPEMHRVLKPRGCLAVWPPFFWLRRAIAGTGLFEWKARRNGVCVFRRL